MKKTISLLLIIMLLLVPATAATTSGTYRGYPITRVLVNGKEVLFDHVPAHIDDGRTLVPLRFVSEAMGAAVHWDEESFTVSVEHEPAGPEDNRISALEAELVIVHQELKRLTALIEEIALSQRSASDVVAMVQPSVVGILATKTYDDLEEIIDQGTGVILTESGVIVTNTHVVKQRELYTTDIFIIFHDGHVERAELVNWDYLSDIAILKVAETNQPYATLGDSDSLEPGEKVLAIGNPLSLGLRNTVTSGVISGVNRADQSAYPLIQTDAAINSGNSGGPLVNYRGEVIGITSSKIAAFGVEGLGFAIPINLVRDIMSRFTTRGIVRPYLGVVIDEPPFVSLGIPGGRGLTVVEIAKGGPAQVSEIRVDDTLVSLNGVRVNSLLELRKELEMYQPGQEITVTVLRGTQEIELSVVLKEIVTEDDSPYEFGALYPWEAEF